MSQVIWSPYALQGIKRIHQFLKTQDERLANRVINSIRESVTLLSLQPQIGRVIEGQNDDYREWIIPFGRSRYTVRYRLQDNAPIILSVKHQKEAGY